MLRDQDCKSGQANDLLHDLEPMPMAQPVQVIVNSVLCDETLGAQVQMIGLDPV